MGKRLALPERSLSEVEATWRQPPHVTNKETPCSLVGYVDERRVKKPQKAA
jgi:hypothetical protein